MITERVFHAVSRVTVRSLRCSSLHLALNEDAAAAAAVVVDAARTRGHELRRADREGKRGGCGRDGSNGDTGAKRENARCVCACIKYIYVRHRHVGKDRRLRPGHAGVSE